MPSRLYKILAVLGVVFITTFSFWFWTNSNKLKNLEVSFLDVGQGDAILVHAPTGQRILIDTGDGADIARRLAANMPWLERRIDLLVITHPHDDHLGDFAEVIKYFNVGEVLYTGVTHTSPGYLNFLREIKDRKIPMKIVDHRQKITLGQDCYLDVLFPQESFVNAKVKNLNNTSIALKIIYKNTSILAMGDLEITELTKLAQAVDLSANILKVSHHGSRNGLNADLLAKINPQVAVIEVGEKNLFGHPDGGVIKLLERAKIKTYRTDVDGDVKMESDGERIYRIDTH